MQAGSGTAPHNTLDWQRVPCEALELPALPSPSLLALLPLCYLLQRLLSKYEGFYDATVEAPVAESPAGSEAAAGSKQPPPAAAAAAAASGKKKK